MRHQNQGRSLLTVEVKHQLHDLFAGCKVQATRGLISQQHCRAHHKSPGQCDALLLTTAEHLGVSIEPLRKAYTTQHLSSGGTRVFAIGQLQWQHHVFQRSQVAQELKALKHKTHLLRPQRSAVVFVDGKQILARQPHRAAGGGVQARHDGQQGAFARARSAHNSGGLFGF